MHIIREQMRALTALIIIAWSGAASAMCAGAASPDSLKGFVANPAAWLDSNGTASDLGPRVKAHAAAAVNSKDPGFGKALNAILGKASGDQGTAIGKSLGGLVGSCRDATDPDDVADKKYISENILPNIAASSSANVAYGDATGPQAASTGGGGAGAGGGSSAGGGLGSIGNPASSASSSNSGGVTDTNNGTTTQASTVSSISSSSSSSGSTDTTSGITITETISSTTIP